MDRPVVALDVDGVLNALGRTSRRPPQAVLMRSEWVTCLTNPAAAGQILPIRLDPDRDSRFLAALEAVGVQVVWCTTWETAANEAIGPLIGLGPRDVLAISEFAGHPPGPAAAKIAAIDHHFPDRRVLWLDDDALAARPQWAARADRTLLAPDRHRGLTTGVRLRALRWALAATGQDPHAAVGLLRDAGPPDRSPREARILGAPPGSVP